MSVTWCSADSVTSSVRRTDPRRPSTKRRWLIAALLCLAGLANGCGRDDALETAYGERLGSAGLSVNGTSVLADMFREAGCRPVTVSYLASRLEQYDVVVWAPDDFSLPSEEVRAFLEEWLTAQPDRTLVYIGRDYQAACDYWTETRTLAPADLQYEFLRRAARARSAHSRDRLQMPDEAVCDWFVIRRDFAGEHVPSLEGPWSVGIDVSRSRIWSQGRLDIPSDAELQQLGDGDADNSTQPVSYTPLLTSGERVLAFRASRADWNGSQILVVANGSFLLNLPLVNHQHRQLAGHLISACPGAAAVAFLESGAGGPLVMDRGDQKNEETRRTRVLLTAHWFFLGALFCFAVFPIFGRPRTIDREPVADFGQHVEALASLLQRTGDHAYARQQLELYHNPHRTDTRPDGTRGQPPARTATSPD